MRQLVAIEDSLHRIEQGKSMGEVTTLDEMRVGTLVDEIYCASRDDVVYQNALGPIQRDYECPEQIPFMLKPKPQAGGDGSADVRFYACMKILR